MFKLKQLLMKSMLVELYNPTVIAGAVSGMRAKEGVRAKITKEAQDAVEQIARDLSGELIHYAQHGEETNNKSNEQDDEDTIELMNLYNEFKKLRTRFDEVTSSTRSSGGGSSSHSNITGKGV